MGRQNAAGATMHRPFKAARGHALCLSAVRVKLLDLTRIYRNRFQAEPGELDLRAVVHHHFQSGGFGPRRRLGILITELIWHGVNGVTGDYSRGAAGFLIVNGEIGPAVAEITIASNLKQMFATLEPASDLRFRRSVDSPTILSPEMTVASA
jgi:hypothetical protein